MVTLATEPVRTEVQIENLHDLYQAGRGKRPDDKVRRITIPDAVVNPKATPLALPARLIEQLGLAKQYETQATFGRGTILVSVCDPVRLTIQGRDCTVDVVEIPDEIAAIVGQVPLGLL